jgi:hypothetical protein
MGGGTTSPNLFWCWELQLLPLRWWRARITKSWLTLTGVGQLVRLGVGRRVSLEGRVTGIFSSRRGRLVLREKGVHHGGCELILHTRGRGLGQGQRLEETAVWGEELPK